MKNRRKTLWAVAAFVVAGVLVGCSPTASDAQQSLGESQGASDTVVLATPAIDLTAVDDEGNTTIDLANSQLSLSAPSGLSEDEASGLLFMREEEKLAHDVYLALYDKWGLPIFQNIANSEQTHTEAVKALLDAHRLADPAAHTSPGEFVNSDLQALYDDLTARGSQSLSDALKVGAAIEEIDILDLETQLAQTENASLRTVYENLMKGSRNHLRSFTSTLSRQASESYEPQYLSAVVYQSIVGSSIEAGGRRNGNGRWGIGSQ